MNKLFFGVMVLILAAMCISPVSAVYVACVNGTDATIGVNWTFTGAPGTLALVSNVGTPSNALLDFTIPTGADGMMNQTPGAPGASASVTVNNTHTLPPGSSATVTNIGTPTVVVLDFGIPSGESGDSGDLSQFLFINGSRSMTGNLSMGSRYITGLSDPTSNQEAATKNYVDTHSNNYNASYWTGTNYNSSYWVGTNYNVTYDAKNNYNASYWTGTNYNSSYITSASNYNASYWTGTNYNSTYDAKNNYNSSYWTGTNYNSSYLTSDDDSVYLFANGTRAMTGNLSMGSRYINGVITGIGSDAVNRSYVDSGLPYVLSTNSSLILAGNTSYVSANNASLLLTSNTSVATTTYVGAVNTSMKNYVDAGLPYISSTNASVILAGNTSFVASNNASLLLTSNTSIATTTYVGSVNTSMKNYVDAGLPYIGTNNQSIILAGNASFVAANNASLLLTSNSSVATTTYVGSVNTSMKNYVDNSNTSMKNYVDAGLPYVGVNNQSIILAGNGSFVATTNASLVLVGNTSYILANGQRAMAANLSMGSYYINNLVTGNPGTSAVNRSYVDSGLPYVLATNTSLLLGTNSSIATTTYVGSVNTSMKNYVDNLNTTMGNQVSATNTSMKNYVDAGLPYIGTNNQSIILAGNTSFVSSTNASLVTTGNTSYFLVGGQRAMTGNLSMGSKYINSVITGALGSDAINRSYVDSGLPYVTSTNQSIILAGNSSFVAANNASLLLTTNTSVATTSYVGSVNTSMKNYVDAGLPYVSSTNQSIILSGNTSFVSSGNQSIILAGNTSFVAATNASMVTTGNSTYVLIGGQRAMTGNLSMGSKSINLLISGNLGTDAVNKSYVDSVASTYNATYDAKTNYNASYWTGTNYNSSYMTSTYNSTYDAKNNYNASYWTGTNYNASYLSSDDDTPYLFINGTRAMTGNLSMGSKYINSVITGNLGTDAVNRSYVDSGGLPYVAASNASLLLTTNTSVATTTYVNAVDHSMYLFLNGTRGMTGNLTMGGKSITGIVTGVGADAVNRTYVDSGLPYVSSTNASIILAGNTSFVSATNSSLLLTSNTSVATTAYVTSVNTSMKNYVDASNTSMKNYVDGGLPYVASNNASIILAGNTSFVSSGNQSIILAGNTSFVATTNSSLVLTGNTSYVLTGGQRAMTGNLSLGSQYINSLVSGKLGTDAVNKSYVDSVVTTYNATYDAKTNYNSSYWTGTNYNASYLTSDDDTPYLFINGTRGMTGNLSMGSKYINNIITGSLGTDAVNRSYIDAGLPYVSSSNQSIIVSGNTSFVAATNASLVLVGNTSYILNNGQRAMAANLSMGSYYINNLITGTPGASAVNRSYVDAGLPYVASSNTSIITAGNTSFIAATNTSLVLTSNTTYLKNPVASYITLMAGSSMIPTTNPANMDQAETSSNKNNYIYTEFTNGGSENSQWIVDMPSDWNSADATLGKLTFYFLWTSTSGSGTVKWDIAGKLLPDDSVIDTAVSTVGTSTDTLLTAGDMHVSPATTAAVVTSAGSGGQTAIFKVTRDSGSDTLDATARLIGVRVGYIRTLA